MSVPVTKSVAILRPRGEDRVRGGHPWVYRSDIADVVDADAGAIVEVRGPRNRLLGHALFSDQSQITIRMISRDETPIDEAFWRARLDAAIRFRDSLQINATAFRLVHGEADLLPSLIVDRYDDYLVMQTLSQGMDRLAPTLVKLLAEITGAKGILARNDPKVRKLEGLDQKVEVLYGTVPETLSVYEAGITYAVDPWRGQKTGLFLDQRENREAAARNAHGRMLDCFSYTGGFDTIVLDPPAFAKNKAAIPNAMAGYKEINLRALRLLNPGGFLITCSCSYNVDEAMFAEAVFAASSDAHSAVTVVEKRMQGRDHPVLLGVPETYYLKSFILRKVA